MEAGKFVVMMQNFYKIEDCSDQLFDPDQPSDEILQGVNRVCMHCLFLMLWGTLVDNMLCYSFCFCRYRAVLNGMKELILFVVWILAYVLVSVGLWNTACILGGVSTGGCITFYDVCIDVLTRVA